jgi:membrane peptidoglycan carboxypeptidase
VLSITDQAGKAVAVKRTPCKAEITPQVAREATDLLTGDTKPGGTSGDVFQKWYDGNSSQVAGKTGTDTNGKLNTSLWFVGVTPHMVATMALINVNKSEQPLTGIPGMSNSAAQNTADGSTAAALWLAALDPTLKSQHWSWPSPDTVAGAVPVPNVAGQSVSVATSTLAQHGFKVVVLPYECGSVVQQTLVGYYSPANAAPGTTVNVCISSGTKPYIYTPPVIPSSTGSPSGTGSSSPSGPGRGRGNPITPGGPPIIVPH